MTSTDIDKLALTWPQVCAMIGLCRRTIEKLIATGDFPRPRRVAAVNRLLFDAAAVRAWWDRQQQVG